MANNPSSSIKLHFSKASFELLKELKENNNREWYHEHKELIKLDLIEPFAQTLERVSAKLKRTRLPLKGSRQTMFRLNRDTRFSNNKKPYKENIGGLLTPSGHKNESNGLVYIHLDSNGGMMAAGFYRFSATQLAPIRQRMLDEPKAWHLVKRALFKAQLELDRSNNLKSMPRGFNGFKDHEHAEYLKLKNLIVQKPLPKTAWLKDDVVNRATEFAKAVTPLLLFQP